MSHVNEIDAWCSQYERAGYRPVPLAANAKVPPKGFPLAAHYRGEVPAAELRGWFTPGCNIGLATGELVVTDFDLKACGQEFVERHRDLLETVVETARGLHCYFQSPCPGFATQKLEHGDLKADGGYVVAPSSAVDGWTYRFLDGHALVPLRELPVFDPALVDLRPPPPARRRYLGRAGAQETLAYIATKHAVSGQGRHRTTFHVVCALARAGFSEFDALDVLIGWNATNVRPRWTVRELIHKVRDGFRNQQQEQ